MAIKELENFRSKYPQYSDISDDDLANRLAKKYPDAYGDLPTKLQENVNQSKEIGVLQSILDVPAATSRAAIRENPYLGIVGPFAGTLALTGIGGEEAKQAASQASQDPESVPTFQESFVGGEIDKGVGDAVKLFPSAFLGTAADIATSPADALIDVATAGIGKIAKLGKTGKVLKETKKVVKNRIPKIAKPSTVGKTTPKQINKYVDDATLAVDSVVKNQKALRLVDDAGNVTTKLPENLSEFNQALEQTRKNTFNMYNFLKKQAGEAGATVDLTPIANKIDDAFSSKVLADIDPSTVQNAQNISKTLRQRGAYSLDEAQQALEQLNKRLSPYYKNPTRNEAGGAAIDMVLKKELLDATDNVITKEVRPGFKELRKRYGALRNIEQDISKQVVNEMKRNKAGLLDFVNIYNVGDVVAGATTGNIGQLMRGTAGTATKTFFSKMNDKDRMVRKMFEAVNKANNPKVIPRASIIAPAVLPQTIRNLENE